MHKRIFAFALSLSLFCIMGCSEGTKEELFDKGRKMMEGDNPRGAIVLLANALEKDPNYLEARLELAKAYALVGKYDSAEKEYTKAKLQNPASDETRIRLAKVFVQQMRPDEALGEIKDLITDSSSNSEAFEVAGYAYALKKDSNAAKKYFLKALSVDNNNVSADLGLAKIHISAGEWEKARAQVKEILVKTPANRAALLTYSDIQSYERDWKGVEGTLDKILSNDPGDLEVLLRKGYLHIKLGENEKALVLAEDLIERFPKGPQGQQLKGMALYHLGRYDESVVALQRADSLRPNVITYYYLGLSQYSKGDLEQSLGSLYKALDIEPGMGQARILVAAILAKQSRTDDAIREAQRVLEIDENNAAAHNLLGSLYMAKGMYEEGMQELNTALEIEPAMADAHVKKGILNLRMGNPRDGEESLANAVSIDPELLNSRMLLASHYRKAKKYDEARRTLQEGLKGTKNDALVLNLIAELDLQQNKTSDAIASLKKAIDINPDLASSYFNLASIYFTSGDRAAALKPLRDLAKRSPENARAHITMGSILEYDGKKDEAHAEFRKAAETGAVEGYLALARNYLMRNDAGAALKVLDEGIDRTTSPALLYDLKGEILMRFRKYDEALSVYETLQKIDWKAGYSKIIRSFLLMRKPERAVDKIKKEMRQHPDVQGLMADLSKLYLTMGRRQEAIDTAREIISKYPRSSSGYVTLAGIYQKEKDYPKTLEILRNAACDKDATYRIALGAAYAINNKQDLALAEFQEAQRISPRNVAAMFQEAVTLHSSGRRSEAIAKYETVLGLSPNFVPALNNLAYLYSESKDERQRALRLAARAYVLSPADGKIQDTLGYALLKNGDVTQAIKVFQAALETFPDSPTVHYHLALALKAKEQKKMAIDSLEKALGLGDFPEENDARSLLNDLKRNSKS